MCTIILIAQIDYAYSLVLFLAALLVSFPAALLVSFPAALLVSFPAALLVSFPAALLVSFPAALLVSFPDARSFPCSPVSGNEQTSGYETTALPHSYTLLQPSHAIKLHTKLLSHSFLCILT